MRSALQILMNPLPKGARHLLAILFVCQSSFAEGVLRFAVEYSRPKIFQGEIVQASFVLYSSYDRVEVEVAKFPEFRGFWSENTALRQGPLMLLPDPQSMGMRKAVVGTYMLTPMVGAEATVTPMRLLIRTFSATGTEETTMDSEAAPLAILPPAPVPGPLKSLYKGGVGHFSLRAETPVVRFFPKEPTAVRYYLSGNGNFAEVNALTIGWPDAISVVSQRSSSIGSGLFQTKTFEYTVTVDGENTVVIPPLSYVYFSPVSGRYETAVSESVRLDPMKRMAEEPIFAPVELPIEKTPSIVLPLRQRTGFLWVQGLLAGLWALLALAHTLKAFRRHQNDSAWASLKLRWKHFFKNTVTEPMEWFETAERLVFDTVDAHSPKKIQTRREAVEKIRRSWGETVAEPARRLFLLWEEVRFSPERPPPPSPAEWTPILKGLKKTLFRRRMWNFPKWKKRSA